MFPLPGLSGSLAQRRPNRVKEGRTSLLNENILEMIQAMVKERREVGTSARR